MRITNRRRCDFIVNFSGRSLGFQRKQITRLHIAEKGKYTANCNHSAPAPTNNDRDMRVNVAQNSHDAYGFLKEILVIDLTLFDRKNIVAGNAITSRHRKPLLNISGRLLRAASRGIFRNAAKPKV